MTDPVAMAGPALKNSSDGNKYAKSCAMNDTNSFVRPFPVMSTRTGVRCPRKKIEMQTTRLTSIGSRVEIATLTADLVNAGSRSLRGVEVTITFADGMDQIALRESRAVVVPPSPALAAGERRQFDIAFEHIPTSWNMQQPIVRITGLEFAQ